jgi:hypothetical protein
MLPIFALCVKKNGPILASYLQHLASLHVGIVALAGKLAVPQNPLEDSNAPFAMTLSRRSTTGKDMRNPSIFPLKNGYAVRRKASMLILEPIVLHVPFVLCLILLQNISRIMAIFSAFFGPLPREPSTGKITSDSIYALCIKTVR